ACGRARRAPLAPFPRPRPPPLRLRLGVGKTHRSSPAPCPRPARRSAPGNRCRRRACRKHNSDTPARPSRRKRRSPSARRGRRPGAPLGSDGTSPALLASPRAAVISQLAPARRPRGMAMRAAPTGARERVVAEESGAAEDPAIAEYLESMRVERRASPHTLRAYSAELERLRSDVAPDGAARWADVDADRLRRFLARRAEEVGRRSLARTVAVVRSFFAFAKRRGRVASNPAAAIGSPRFTRALPRYVPESDVDRLFRASSAIPDEAAARDVALLEVLYGSGLRASEAVALDWRDVSLDD